MHAAIGLLFAQGRGLRGSNVARSNAVALDVVLAILGADIPGQHLQAALGRRVGGNGLTAQLAHHGADVDDLAMALLDHGGDDGLGHDEGGVQVHVDHLAELLSGHFRHGDALDDAGVVHQNVDDAHLALHLRDKGIHRLLVGDVTHIAVGLDALLGVGSQALVHQLLLDVVEHDGGARLAHGTGDGKADAIAGAGDQGYLTLQGERIHNVHVQYSFLTVRVDLPLT